MIGSRPRLAKKRPGKTKSDGQQETRAPGQWRDSAVSKLLSFCIAEDVANDTVQEIQAIQELREWYEEEGEPNVEGDLTLTLQWVKMLRNKDQSPNYGQIKDTCNAVRNALVDFRCIPASVGLRHVLQLTAFNFLRLTIEEKGIPKEEAVSRSWRQNVVDGRTCLYLRDYFLQKQDGRPELALARLFELLREKTEDCSLSEVTLDTSEPEVGDAEARTTTVSSSESDLPADPPSKPEEAHSADAQKSGCGSSGSGSSGSSRRLQEESG